MAYVERRLELGGDLASGTVGGFIIGNSGVVTLAGQVNSGLNIILGSGAIVSGMIGSGVLAPNSFGTGASIAISGNFSWSGVSAGTSGVAIVSGAFTARNTGKLLITATAFTTGASGLSITHALISGVGVQMSGLGGVPSQTTVAVWANLGVPFSYTTLQTAPVIGTPQNYAIIAGPTASGLISGAGQITITELVN